MTLEYLLLLTVSIGILLGSFGMKTGPVQMLSTSSPMLGFSVEKRIITAYRFSVNNDNRVGWKRR